MIYSDGFGLPVMGFAVNTRHFHRIYRATVILFGAAIFAIFTTGCSDDAVDREANDQTSQDGGADTSVDGGDTGDADTGKGDEWPPPRQGCNGHDDLCERSFDEVVFPGTHNAMSNAEEEWGAPNQNLPLRTQLIDGVRLFLLDVHEEDGEILLCHTTCLLGSRPLADAMEEFRSFLEANPGEVVTIIFEDHVPGESIVDVLEESGIDAYVYAHDEQSGWPTLAQMIDAETRLVVTNETAGPPPEWLHSVWDLGWDTPYSFGSVDEFSCAHNRGTTDEALFLVNHWVLNPLPNPETAAEVNDYETLMARIDKCEDQWARLPTFIAVDFYDIGDLFEVVDVLNGLVAPR